MTERHPRNPLAKKNRVFALIERHRKPKSYYELQCRHWETLQINQPHLLETCMLMDPARRDVLCGGTGLSWEPMLMSRACRKPRKPDNNINDFTVINCVTWREEKINIHKFFTGYTEGLYDAEGRLKLLKLEDWPPAESFQEQVPRHFVEFVRCLPFMPYTHPHDGHLNISTRVLVLGPKMSICYGVGQDLGSTSLTMLHYALSDRVDILMHTAEIRLSPEHLSGVENMRRVEGLKEPEGGAVWDVFSRQDVPKLEEYLRKHAGELKHISCRQQFVHPIHDKVFYLSVEHKRKLKVEYGIEPWTLVQKLGDAIFVPAGCPHQIRYLKSCTSVGYNFVAPESIGECIRLAAEYRHLPQNHRCKEDKLQVKQMILQSVAQAVEAITLNAITKLPLEHLSRRENLVIMKRNLEAMKSTLDLRAHLVRPDLRPQLEKGIQDLLPKVEKEINKH